MSSDRIKAQFLEELGGTARLELAFEYLPDVLFFAKNRQGQFVMANRLFCEKCGARSEQELLGKTDRDYFPRETADRYARDDRKVLRTGQPIVNRIEAAPEAARAANLSIACKIPLYGRDGSIVGLAGFARDLKRPPPRRPPATSLSAAVEHLEAHYAEPLEIPKLAALAAMSVSRFERKFKQVFQLTPQQYLIQLRIHRACRQLVETQDTISGVAQDSGFYDHSHFTRQFTRTMGCTPKAYRRAQADAPPPPRSLASCPPPRGGPS